MIKEAIKKIPVLGAVLQKIYQVVVGNPKFTSSSDYWEKRYRKGGNSGVGSYDQLAAFKAEVLNQFVEENKVASVIEFGCGDGNQLQYFHFNSYIGFDVSATAIDKCRSIYQMDTTKRFEMVTAYKGEKADLVLSLDVIYHLVENEVYHEYMQQLFAASEKYVIIYSSNQEVPDTKGIADHVRHRKFTDWVETYAPDFKLIQHIPNKYSPAVKGTISSFADFYIFQMEKG